jgi:uncharacterized membrane protein
LVAGAAWVYVTREAMERLFEQFAGGVALALECVSVLLIAWGAVRAALLVFKMRADDVRDPHGTAKGRGAFLQLGRYLLLGLEFTLAADVVHTAIAPSWDDIGKLGAIALIRTFLNYFLERDIEQARAQMDESVRAARPAE